MSTRWWKTQAEETSGGPIDTAAKPALPDDQSPAAEPFVLEVTDVLDLHSFSPRDVKVVVEAYLEEARAKGFERVRIVHGKGIGVQREIVRAVLQRTEFVISIEQAPAEAGSWGATIAYLRRGQGTE